MNIRELSLLLYISTVKSSKEQSFDFIHKVYGKKTANSLVNKGFIGKHADDVYVMTSYGAGVVKGLKELSGYIARFGNAG